MRKLLVGIVGMIIGCAITSTAHHGNEYPTTLIVTEVHGEVCIAVTATGIPYILPCEDLDVGDLVACIMNDKDTPDVHDDEMVSMRYAGYTELFERR